MGMKRVLVFSSREICYFSGTFFSEQLAGAFEELGYEVLVCHIEPEEDYEEKLMRYLDQEFACIVDINSLLPRLGLEDGSRYLEHLHGPFFDLIVDHPLFHHNTLLNATDNMHAVVLDIRQSDYIRQYYPMVKHVHMLPLSANEASCSAAKEKEKKVLVIGTMEREEHIRFLLDSMVEKRKNAAWSMIERILSDPELTYEEALASVLRERGEALSQDAFAVELNALYPVQFYIRNYYRKKAVQTLLDAKIPVKVIGDGWEKIPFSNESYLERKKGIHIAVSYEAIADEWLLFNCTPFFNHGIHDRILAGMANHTAVLTDRNAYIKEQLEQPGYVKTYDLLRMETLADEAAELILDEHRWHEMTDRAYDCFKKEHTWKNRAKQLFMYADAGRTNIYT